MTLSANTSWEVRTTGDDTNGGGFVEGASGTDYSQQAAAELSLTDLACTTGTATLTSVTGGFTTAMVGNLIQISAGTNFTTGFYQIMSHTDTNTVTIDRDPTNGSNASGGEGKVGGALAGPVKATGSMVTGNDLWIQAGTYSISAAVDLNSFDQASRDNWTRIIGYETTRGDNGVKPILQAASSGIDIIHTRHTAFVLIHNLEIDGNSLSSVNGVNYTLTSGFHMLSLCHVHHCTSRGVGVKSYPGIIYRCEINNCGTGVYGENELLDCYVHHNTGEGWDASSSSVIATRTIFASNGSDGAEAVVGGTRIKQCIFYGNGGFGWANRSSSGSHNELWENIFVANGSYGVRSLVGEHQLVHHNAFFGNTSGQYSGGPAVGPDGTRNDIILTADPFVDAVNGDFNINDVEGGGAVLRALSYNLTG